MKTPQEQAEELLCGFASSMIPIPTDQDPYPCLRERELLKAEVSAAFPLPELIAVAQAANKVATEKSIRNQMQAEFEMLKALDALRATRKVEL